VCSQAPRTRSSTSGLTRAKARRKVDSSAGPRPARPGPPGPHRRPTARSRRTTATPRSPPRSPRPAAPPARVGARASPAGPGPGQGDRAGTGCGPPQQAKMSSAAGRPSRQEMVSVGTSIVPPGPCPPLADTPGTSSTATTPQVTASIHDFAVSLSDTRGINPETERPEPAAQIPAPSCQNAAEDKFFLYRKSAPAAGYHC
jgi:hypothetical protein